MVRRIKDLCKEKGKTLFSLEQECGFGNGTINKWDANSPSVSKIIIVANILGVSVYDLIEEEIEKFNKISPQFIRRVKLLKQRGISYKELSQQTGISTHRLKHYFSDDTWGNTDFWNEFPKLARALGVSPQYLCCLTDQENDESDTDEKFRNYLMGHSNLQDSFPKFLYEQKEPTPVFGDGLDPKLVALIKQIPADRMPEVERYLRFQAEQEEKP